MKNDKIQINKSINMTIDGAGLIFYINTYDLTQSLFFTREEFLKIKEAILIAEKEFSNV